jgi:hypothetical protein
MESMYGKRIIKLLALSTLLLACGIFGGGPDSTGSGPQGPDATVETAPGDGPLPDASFAVNQAFWHSGFRIQLTDGRFYAVEEDFTGDITYFVSLAATFENLGDSDTFFDGAAALVVNGEAHGALFSSDRPTVPSGLSASGEFLFTVDGDFDPTNAQLLVGSGSENRAQVPLTPQGGELVTLEPSEPPVSGSISLQMIDLHLTSAILRADNPVSYSQIESGKLAHTLYFDAVSRQGGNWSILAQDFTLTLPSGSTVGVDGSDLGSLPGSDEGLETTGLYVRFLVDDPAAGSYTLRFTPGDWFVGDDGVSEGTLSFTIE